MCTVCAPERKRAKSRSETMLAGGACSYAVVWLLLHVDTIVLLSIFFFHITFKD